MRKVKIFCENAVVPMYQTSGSAGVDLQSNSESSIMIEAGNRALIPTGIYLQIPEGYEAQIRPRSGLTLKHGVTVLNSPGTIDADYRGQIGVILQNSGNKPFYVNKGDRIAQMVFKKVEIAEFSQVLSLDKLTNTSRGIGGFGSTGKN